MKDMLSDYLLSRRAAERGNFNRGYVEWLVNKHLSGLPNFNGLLWNLLMLELWHRRFIDSSDLESSQRSSP